MVVLNVPLSEDERNRIKSLFLEGESLSQTAKRLLFERVKEYSPFMLEQAKRKRGECGK